MPAYVRAPGHNHRAAKGGYVNDDLLVKMGPGNCLWVQRNRVSVGLSIVKTVLLLSTESFFFFFLIESLKLVM